MNLIYLSLGSNLGHRKQHLDEAIKLIQSRIGRIYPATMSRNPGVIPVLTVSAIAAWHFEPPLIRFF